MGGANRPFLTRQMINRRNSEEAMCFQAGVNQPFTDLVKCTGAPENTHKLLMSLLFRSGLAEKGASGASNLTQQRLEVDWGPLNLSVQSNSLACRGASCLVHSLLHGTSKVEWGVFGSLGPWKASQLWLYGLWCSDWQRAHCSLQEKCLGAAECKENASGLQSHSLHEMWGLPRSSWNNHMGLSKLYLVRILDLDPGMLNLKSYPRVKDGSGEKWLQTLHKEQSIYLKGDAGIFHDKNVWSGVSKAPFRLTVRMDFTTVVRSFAKVLNGTRQKNWSEA